MERLFTHAQKLLEQKRRRARLKPERVTELLLLRADGKPLGMPGYWARSRAETRTKRTTTTSTYKAWEGRRQGTLLAGDRERVALVARAGCPGGRAVGTGPQGPGGDREALRKVRRAGRGKRKAIRFS